MMALIAATVGLYSTKKPRSAPKYVGGVDVESMMQTTSTTAGQLGGIVSTKDLLLAGLETPTAVPAMVFAGCGTNKPSAKLIVGRNEAIVINWVPVSKYRIEICPGFEVVASDGISDQIWYGPIIECVNHASFTPSVFVVRRSSSASIMGRHKLPSERIGQSQLDVIRASGGATEILEQQVEVVGAENVDLNQVYTFQERNRMLA